MGLNFIYKFILMIILSKILSLLNSPEEIFEALNRFFSPLSHLGISMGWVAVIFFLILSFVPILTEEGQRYKKEHRLTKRGLIPFIEYHTEVLSHLFQYTFYGLKVEGQRLLEASSSLPLVLHLRGLDYGLIVLGSGFLIAGLVFR